MRKKEQKKCSEKHILIVLRKKEKVKREQRVRELIKKIVREEMDKLK